MCCFFIVMGRGRVDERVFIEVIFWREGRFVKVLGFFLISFML